MTTAASERDLVALRLDALFVSRAVPAEGDGADGVTTAARAMLAVQGQDPVAAQWALGSRVAQATRADVFEAFQRGSIVRSWPMRSTVHVMAAEDLGWLQRLTLDRVMGDAARRREQLGLELATLERMRDIAVTELQGGRALPRAELIAAFGRDGIVMQQGWAYHAVWFLSQTGTLVFGPPSGQRDNLIVLADEWITAPKMFEGDAALAELAARYAASHGPATVADLCWWTKMTVASVKRAFAIAESSGRVARVRCADTEYWLSAQADLRDAASVPDLRLLPAFDETLLGYRDRGAVLAAERARDVMSSNGIASPTILADGRIAGTWSHRGDATTVTPFDAADSIDAVALERETSRIRDFFAG